MFINVCTNINMLLAERCAIFAQKSSSLTMNTGFI